MSSLSSSSSSSSSCVGGCEAAGRADYKDEADKVEARVAIEGAWASSLALFFAVAAARVAIVRGGGRLFRRYSYVRRRVFFGRGFRFVRLGTGRCSFERRWVSQACVPAIIVGV